MYRPLLTGYQPKKPEGKIKPPKGGTGETLKTKEKEC